MKTIIENDAMVVVADNGKVLRRKADGAIFGERVSLGYDHYISGEKLAEPRLAQVEDYEEVDIPEDYFNPEILP